MIKETKETPIEESEVVAEKVTENNPPTEEIKTDEVVQETTQFDPLAESGEELGSQPGEDAEDTPEETEKDSGNIGEEIEKTDGNAIEDLEKPLEGIENPLENIGNDAEEHEKVLIVEEKEDPLINEDDPEPRDPEEPEVSDEYREWMSQMAVNGINFIDELKTKVCVALGGGYASDYATSSFVKNSLVTSFKELAQQKEMAAPSPMQVFLMSLGAMTAPSILLVLFRRNIRPVADHSNREKVEASNEPEAKTDYTNTIEYQEGRKKFKVHAKGAYMHCFKGEYVNANIADSYPSPEVQKLIKDGVKPSEIKKIIYG